MHDGEQGPAPPSATALSYDGLAHELRTPLASIRSIAEILHDYPDLETDARQRFLAAVLVEQARLERTVERLLDGACLWRLAPEGQLRSNPAG